MSCVCLSSVCQVQGLSCIVFVMSRVCYIYVLLCLGPRVCYVQGLSSLGSVMSRVCYVAFVCLGFVMSSFCLSRVGYGTCLLHQNKIQIQYYNFAQQVFKIQPKYRTFRSITRMQLCLHPSVYFRQFYGKPSFHFEKVSLKGSQMKFLAMISGGGGGMDTQVSYLWVNDHFKPIWHVGCVKYDI